MSKPNRSQNKSLRLSQLIPIIGTQGDLQKKGFIIPGLLTVAVIVGLFETINNSQHFNLLLAVYLASIAYYFIYQLCGKYKPWWLLVGCAATTGLFLVIPVVMKPFFYIFREILPGNPPKDPNFISTFIEMFFGAGLMEELIKVLPVFFVMWIGRDLKSPWRERIGVWEPLDGILLATASAVGFTLVETMGQYVPGTIVRVAKEAGVGTGELIGLQLLIPRILGSVAGHMAYSGYFGYFIGLSVLKPSKRWLILAIGYLTASTIHALWNSVGRVGGNVAIVAQALAGILAYTFLIAAILKARQLSPTRSQNWATQYVNVNTPPQSSPPIQNPYLNTPPQSLPLTRTLFSLSIQQRMIPLGIGTQIQASQIPGLGAQARGIVAEVNANPQDPNILGLKNCSHQVWNVTLANGQQTSIDPNRSVKLASGTKINFGAVTGAIL
jgi:RsiW-degrading membrane proteinase PrsW (M82 family)